MDQMVGWCVHMSAQDQQNIELLIEHLHAPDLTVRHQAMVDLESIGAPAIPFLIPLLQDRSGVVRYHVAEILGEIADARAVPPLIQALDRMTEHGVWEDSEGENDFREPMIGALGKIADERGVPSLIRALKDESSEAFGEAGAALMRIGEPALTPLIQALTDSNPWVRTNAAYILDQLRSRPTVAPPDTTSGDEGQLY